MLNIYILLVVMVLAVMPAARAETIVLKSGSVVNGRILEQDADKVKVDVNGVPLTYYMDQISSIDGIDAGVANPNPQALPVVPPPQPSAAQKSLTNTLAESSGKSKRDLILKFIDVFGTRESLINNFNELIKRSNPQQAELIKKTVNIDELIEQLIPIYDEHFTEEELTAYISFYSSVKGKKLLETVPTIMGESVDVSMKYLQEKLKNASVQEKK